MTDNIQIKQDIKTGKLALLNSDLQLTDFLFDSIEQVDEDYIVETGNSFGIINKNGEFVVSMTEKQKTNIPNLWFK